MLATTGASLSLSGRHGSGRPRRSCDRTDGVPSIGHRAADAIAAAGPLNVKQVLDFPTPQPNADLRALLDLTVAGEHRLARSSGVR